MKIVCDCGNTDMIVIDNEDPDPDVYYGSVHGNFEHHNFDLHAQHDELWITCNKCEKSFHLFA